MIICPIAYKIDKIGSQFCQIINKAFLLGRVRFKHCLRPDYFLLQSIDFVMKTYMLLAGVRVHELW